MSVKRKETIMDREAIARNAPESGRRATLVRALELLHDARAGQPSVIVEVGTSRGIIPLACITDGWATRVFAWYASQAGGKVLTMDIQERAIRAARQLCAAWEQSVEFLVASADDVLPTLTQIDLLYMDGPADAEDNLRIYRSLPFLPRFVLWDDVIGWESWDPGPLKLAPPRWYEAAQQHRPWAPRGTLAIPVMETDGYRIVFHEEHQVLLELAP
jgi:hypothetical protein